MLFRSDATVEQCAKGKATVRLHAAREAAPEPPVAVTLAQAVLKGDKMDDLVRDAVMIGASVIQPLVTARTEIALATLQRSTRTERWHRIAVSSAKQCGRAVIPRIAEPIALDTLFEGVARTQIPTPALMLVEPGASTDAVRLNDFPTEAPREATVIIGPEGGWSAEELERGVSACSLLTFGGRTLRADAMPLVALSVLFAHWREF